ncbi:hypothetical protein NHG25_02210 [Aerococcaceae bacterium NML191292]|nr:hypothetical protein [Aerococcaceae bacterium NML191292]
MIMSHIADKLINVIFTEIEGAISDCRVEETCHLLCEMYHKRTGSDKVKLVLEQGKCLETIVQRVVKLNQLPKDIDMYIKDVIDANRYDLSIPEISELKEVMSSFYKLLQKSLSKISNFSPADQVVLNNSLDNAIKPLHEDIRRAVQAITPKFNSLKRIRTISQIDFQSKRSEEVTRKQLFENFSNEVSDIISGIKNKVVLNQKNLLEQLKTCVENNPLTCIVGEAGTGKTILMCQMAYAFFEQQIPAYYIHLNSYHESKEIAKDIETMIANQGDNQGFLFIDSPAYNKECIVEILDNLVHFDRIKCVLCERKEKFERLQRELAMEGIEFQTYNPCVVEISNMGCKKETKYSVEIEWKKEVLKRMLGKYLSNRKLTYDSFDKIFDKYKYDSLVMIYFRLSDIVESSSLQQGKFNSKFPWVEWEALTNKTPQFKLLFQYIAALSMVDLECTWDMLERICGQKELVIKDFFDSFSLCGLNKIFIATKSGVSFLHNKLIPKFYFRLHEKDWCQLLVDVIFHKNVSEAEIVFFEKNLFSKKKIDMAFNEGKAFEIEKLWQHFISNQEYVEVLEKNDRYYSLEFAEVYISECKREDNYDLYKALLEKYSTHSKLWFIYSENLKYKRKKNLNMYSKEKEEEILNLFHSIKDGFGKWEKVQCNVAKYLDKSNRVSEALSLYKEVADKFPEDIPSRLGCAEILEKDPKTIHTAISYLREILEISDKYSDEISIKNFRNATVRLCKIFRERRKWLGWGIVKVSKESEMILDNLNNKILNFKNVKEEVLISLWIQRIYLYKFMRNRKKEAEYIRELENFNPSIKNQHATTLIAKYYSHLDKQSFDETKALSLFEQVAKSRGNMEMHTANLMYWGTFLHIMGDLDKACAKFALIEYLQLYHGNKAKFSIDSISEEYAKWESGKKLEQREAIKDKTAKRIAKAKQKQKKISYEWKAMKQAYQAPVTQRSSSYWNKKDLSLEELQEVAAYFYRNEEKLSTLSNEDIKLYNNFYEKKLKVITSIPKRYEKEKKYTYLSTLVVLLRVRQSFVKMDREKYIECTQKIYVILEKWWTSNGGKK